MQQLMQDINKTLHTLRLYGKNLRLAIQGAK